MSQASNYEVRCERCRTSFAPETKRCVHCGGPLGKGLFASFQQARPTEPVPESHPMRAGSEGHPMRAGPDGAGPPEALFEPEEDGQAGLAGKVRNRLYVVLAFMMIVGSLVRTCTPG